jgi:hypothetical protein
VACSIAAIVVVAVGKHLDLRMTALVILNAAAYWVAYAIRLRRMTLSAKVTDRERTQGWFLGEMVVALATQLLLPLLGTMLPGVAGDHLVEGFTEINGKGLLVGVLYGALYCFGTLVYLDSRENAFCVPLNRGASLLAGIAACTLIGTPPTRPELVAVGLVVTAILALSPAHHLASRVLARVFHRETSPPQPMPPTAPACPVEHGTREESTRISMAA